MSFLYLVSQCSQNLFSFYVVYDFMMANCILTTEKSFKKLLAKCIHRQQWVCFIVFESRFELLIIGITNQIFDLFVELLNL